MGRENIEKKDNLYKIIKSYTKYMFYRFYKNIYISGYKENVPENEPVIFAINHQNTLMDALAVLYTIKGQPVFMARSDIFKKPIVNKILTFLKILPIYRIIDGRKKLKNNNEIFSKTIDILKKNKTLVILPEGSHEGIRKLRNLKKGIARIVFQAAENTNFTLKPKIIPVGLDYSNYFNYDSDLLVNYGKPIEVSQFYELYKENPQKAMNSLLAEIKKQLSKLMVDIQNDEYYNLYQNIRIIYRKRMLNILKLKFNNLKNKLIADKRLIDNLDNIFKETPEVILNLNNKVNDYVNGLKKQKLRDWIFEKENSNVFILITESILLILLFPIHLFGFINNYLPFKIPVWFVNSKIKDKQFHSSLKYVFYILLFPIFYLILFIIVWIFIDIWWFKFIYLLSLPPSGIFAYKYYILFKKHIAKWRYIIKVINKDDNIIMLSLLRKSIIYETDNIIFNKWTN
ncbi:MAG: 1-acyl-sn-glycerol-3-phosphate acyltransferase [Bacteroidales bacterium]|nr:1-acyl-sn-glycerol-3-phosphate acyltransferase [Bacteroidales bacterium]